MASSNEPLPAGQGLPSAPSPSHPLTHSSGRRLVITFRRSGDLERDKFRLREIYDVVRDPRGRDIFCIRIVHSSQTAELDFPNDGCSINDKLLSDLTRHMKLEVKVE